MTQIKFNFEFMGPLWDQAQIPPETVSRLICDGHINLL